MAKVGFTRTGGINSFKYKPEFKQLHRRNNDFVAACYALYLTGKSVRYIAQVHYRGRFTHQSLYDQFKVRGYPLRSKAILPFILYKRKKYRPDKTGLYRSGARPRPVYLHRLTWNDNYGVIPKDFVVIHRDGDKTNNKISNLLCMHRDDAKKNYNHRNQFGYQRFKNKGQYGT